MLFKRTVLKRTEWLPTVPLKFFWSCDYIFLDIIKQKRKPLWGHIQYNYFSMYCVCVICFSQLVLLGNLYFGTGGISMSVNKYVIFIFTVVIFVKKKKKPLPLLYLIMSPEFCVYMFMGLLRIGQSKCWGNCWFGSTNICTVMLL